MHLQRLSNLFLTSILFSSIAFANDEDEILSKDRLDLFEYSKKQNKENSQKLKKDWINPITFTYTHNRGEEYDYTKSVISVSQPIFKSGGIYSAIKYANANFTYNDIDIDIQKKDLIKEVTTLLYNLHITDLTLEKNNLLLKNAIIDVERKKEQALNGFLDTSTLDNAILDANKIKNTIAELKYQKKELNNNFSSLASGEYNSFELPKFQLISKDEFIEKSLELSKAKADIKQKDNYSDMTIAKYLPSVNLNYDSTTYHSKGGNPSLTQDYIQNYGLSVSIPLDVRTFNDIESQRIEYLKSKLDLHNKILEEQNFYKTKLSKIEMIKEKKDIAKNDYKLYNSLLEVIYEEKKAEIKTQSDVDTLLNSKNIKSLDLKILELEEQIELLEIYSKVI